MSKSNWFESIRDEFAAMGCTTSDVASIGYDIGFDVYIGLYEMRISYDGYYIVTIVPEPGPEGMAAANRIRQVIDALSDEEVASSATLFAAAVERHRWELTQSTRELACARVAIPE